MLAPSLSRLAAAIFATACVSTVSAAPMFGLTNNTKTVTRRDTQDAPHWVIYSDKWISGETGPPAASDLAGYNVFALSFLLTSGASDQATTWAQLTDDDRKKIKQSYADAGIKLVVSAFGATDTPTTAGKDAKDTADTMAAWVKKYDLDGLDIDYEDLSAFDKGDGSAEQWLTDFTTELRSQLGDDALITAAPLAPWFSPGTKWGGGGFLKVDKQVGDKIDFYNVQFYNQGTSEYVDCDGLLTKSSSTWPETSLFEIANNGVSLDKLVIGKPGNSGDATNGFMDTATLAKCVSQAAGQQWNGGVMVWQYPDADSSWVSSVRGTVFPVGSGGSSSSASAAPSSTSSASAAPSTPISASISASVPGATSSAAVPSSSAAVPSSSVPASSSVAAPSSTGTASSSAPAPNSTGAASSTVPASSSAAVPSSTISA